MTVKQYSDLQRCIGKLEGIGVFMEGIQFAYYHDTLETIKNIVEELYFCAESANLSNRSQVKRGDSDV